MFSKSFKLTKKRLRVLLTSYIVLVSIIGIFILVIYLLNKNEGIETDWIGIIITSVLGILAGSIGLYIGIKYFIKDDNSKN